MKNWPCAKFTMLRSPKISDSPSASPVNSCSRNRSRVMGWELHLPRKRSRLLGRARRAPSPCLRGEGWGEGLGDCAHPAPHPLALNSGVPEFGIQVRTSETSDLRASRSLPASGERCLASRLVAELLAGAQDLLVAGLRLHDVEDVRLVLHLGFRLRLDHQHRLHRLVVAFAEVLLAL